MVADRSLNAHVVRRAGALVVAAALLAACGGARGTVRERPSRPVSVVVENSGWRTHELVVLPLVADAVAGQRVPGRDGTVDESGSLGEASASCAAGHGDGIVSGAVGWVTVTLAPGHYELVCNLENHYADGMRQGLVVTG